MPRPRAFDKDEKLKQAMILFWQRGYEGTSMQDLVDHLQINKFSIYNTYGDKQSLYHQALAVYSKEITGAIIAPLRNTSQTGLQRIEGYFRNLASQLSHKKSIIGCFMQNAGLETALKDNTVADMLKDMLNQTEQLLTQCIQNAKEHGELSSTNNTEQLARFLVIQAQGLMVYRKVVDGETVLQDQVDTLLTMMKK
jgi:AcrR family transcriptional regulator